eukprot:TRINITY_DN1144_c0_g1_i1.p1 TRINITY_DN1144_c0_g1~~TRINITY_DN1144_c0_g1_i1.p1  ORF type:complete len:470 (+),score=67.55 TRINITY_DN1144_c0_g1_i1:217-1626(+)
MAHRFLIFFFCIFPFFMRLHPFVRTGYDTNAISRISEPNTTFVDLKANTTFVDLTRGCRSEGWGGGIRNSDFVRLEDLNSPRTRVPELRGVRDHVAGCFPGQPIPSFALENWTSHPLGEVLGGPGLKDPPPPGGEAICFLARILFKTTHFPHYMESGYGCMNWWHAHPGKRRVFVVPRMLLRNVQHRNTPFIRGIWKQFAETLNVTLIHAPVDSSCDLLKYIWTGPARFRHAVWAVHWHFRTVQTAYAFRDPVVKDLFPHRPVSSCTADATPRTLAVSAAMPARLPALPAPLVSVDDQPQRPTIRLLIRSFFGRRALLNARELARRLTQSHSPDRPIVPTRFAGMTFANQIDFFSSTDILVTTHGAELTSIPFMPRCAAVLELLPENYFMVGYYPRLGATAGLNYSWMYMSTEQASTSRNILAPSKVGRVAARESPLCAPVEDIVTLVGRYVEAWHACCWRRAANRSLP